MAQLINTKHFYEIAHTLLQMGKIKLCRSSQAAEAMEAKKK